MEEMLHFFWLDSWLYEKPLETLFRDLYELCENKELSVAQVKKGEIVVTFRRWLIDNLRDTWEHIWEKLLNFKFL